MGRKKVETRREKITAVERNLLGTVVKVKFDRKWHPVTKVTTDAAGFLVSVQVRGLRGEILVPPEVERPPTPPVVTPPSVPPPEPRSHRPDPRPLRPPTVHHDLPEAPPEIYFGPPGDDDVGDIPPDDWDDDDLEDDWDDNEDEPEDCLDEEPDEYRASLLSAINKSLNGEKQAEPTLEERLQSFAELWYVHPAMLDYVQGLDQREKKVVDVFLESINYSKKVMMFKKFGGDSPLSNGDSQFGKLDWVKMLTVEDARLVGERIRAIEGEDRGREDVQAIFRTRLIFLDWLESIRK
ncbi:hypothetical protein ACYOEI_00155 [Singulisphaera rosea]